MESLWQKRASENAIPGYEPLRGDITTDVLIVGGGLAGLLTAHMLWRAGVEFHLAEADRLMSGTSGSTTGKITALHGAVYDRLIREFGTAATRQYYDANTEAANEYRRLCAGKDCGYRECDAFVYSVGDAAKIKKEYNALRRLGIPAEMSACPALPFRTAAAVRLTGQAEFDPIKFAAMIVSDLPRERIFEHTPVRSTDGCTAVTDGGRIHAKRMVIATHFPIIDRRGAYWMKMYQHRSYMLALRGAAPVGGMYVAAEEGGISLRDADDCLIIGGCGTRTGKKCGGFDALERLAGKYFPGSVTVTRWATQDCITLDGMPYIGKYSPACNDIYVATGFNKWGMTGCMAAAMLISDMLTDRENKYRSLFGSRTMLRPQLAVNAAHALTGWLTPTAPRCPHLGCALHWNPAEHTWDCSCHGSRFDAEGHIENSPATQNARIDRQ